MMTHLWIKWHIACGDQERNENGVDGQQSCLYPEHVSLGTVQRLQSKSGERPEVTVCVHQPRREYDAVEVASGARASRRVEDERCDTQGQCIKLDTTIYHRITKTCKCDSRMSGSTRRSRLLRDPKCLRLIRATRASRWRSKAQAAPACKRRVLL